MAKYPHPSSDDSSAPGFRDIEQELQHAVIRQRRVLEDALANAAFPAYDAALLASRAALGVILKAKGLSAKKPSAKTKLVKPTTSPARSSLQDNPQILLANSFKRTLREVVPADMDYEDLFQEALCRLMGQLLFRGPVGSIYAWMSRVLSNLVRDEMRKRKSHRRGDRDVRHVRSTQFQESAADSAIGSESLRFALDLADGYPALYVAAIKARLQSWCEADVIQCFPKELQGDGEHYRRVEKYVREILKEVLATRG